MTALLPHGNFSCRFLMRGIPQKMASLSTPPVHLARIPQKSKLKTPVFTKQKVINSLNSLWHLFIGL
jgi:hypothetical protein